MTFLLLISDEDVVCKVLLEDASCTVLEVDL